jgi:hypothetical protein
MNGEDKLLILVRLEQQTDQSALGQMKSLTVMSEVDVEHGVLPNHS